MVKRYANGVIFNVTITFTCILVMLHVRKLDVAGAAATDGKQHQQQQQKRQRFQFFWNIYFI